MEGTSSLKKQWGIVAALAVLGLIVGTANGGTATITYQVSAGADDGYAWSATEQDITSGHLIIGDGKDYNAPYYMSAMRFANVAIPRSAAIIKAHLKIRSLDEGIRGRIYGIIQAESADDAADFSSRYIAAAAKTAAGINWDHKFGWAKNTWQVSPDISSVVQQIISRPGWTSGNSLSVFYSTRTDWRKSRMFVSFELATAYAPVLEITYQTYTISGYVRTSGGAPIDGVTISAGSDIEATVTDSSGYYELLVPPGWSGTVTPSKAWWGFNPAGRVYINISVDQTNQDYTGFQPKISGYVTTGGGGGIEGVLVSADNGGGSDTTDASGFYELPVLPGWSGTVTPNKTGRNFEPPERSYIDVAAHLTAQDYLSLALTVRADGTGGFPTIQAAIDAAVNGDVVILQPGTFTGNGNRDIDFKGKAITVRGATGDPNDCVIDCEGSYTTPHRGFHFVSAEDTNSVLEGMTITNGFGPKENVGSYIISVGGGIYCRNSRPLIQNCTITGNLGNTFGGGIYNSSLSKPIIRNCSIFANSANEGGGICNYYGSSTIQDCNITQNSGYYRGGGIISYYSDDTTIKNCIVAGNSSHSFGGGIDNFSSSPIIENCAITENSVSHYNGGGIHNYSSSPTIINCTISNNSVSGTDGTSGGGGIHNWYSSPSIKSCIITGNWTLGRGGGIYNRDNTSSNINNCTISDNSANNDSGGIYNDGSSSSSIRNCIVWGNQLSQLYGSTTVTYSDIEEGYTGTGNIDIDPLFEADGYHLSFASPCLNAGDPNYSAEPNETDIDSEPRVVGAQIDIGADEFATEQPFILVSENQYSFAALEGRDNPGANTLQLHNLGLAASLEWTANTNVGWLVITPSSGSLNYEQTETLTVAVDISGLAAGEYSGQITIEDPQAVNSPKVIVVHLTIVGPSLGINQNSFSFQASKETIDPPPEILTISNLTGGGTLSWNIATDCNWMVIEPWAGAITSGSADIILDIDQNNVDYGTHSCQLTVNAPGALNSPQVVTVNLEVLPPQLSISASSFNFTAAGIEANTTPQVLTIQNTGYDSLNWHIEMPNDCDWLNISQMSGQLNTGEIRDIEINVDPNKAGYGAHSCELRVIAADAENSPQFVTVNLDVLGPVISASPTIFEFTCKKAEPNTFSDTLFIQNTGYDTLNWQINISPNCNWLNVSPVTGKSSGEMNEVVLNTDSQGLDNGVYSCELIISDANAENSPATVPVNLHVYTEGERHVPAEYQTIQAAVDEALDGDKVLVEPGIYTGAGNKDIDFLGKAITVQSLDPEDPCTVAATIIDCEGAGRGFYFHNYEEQNSILDGVTIMNGNADYGGGIRCDGGSPTIANCNVIANEAEYNGGGVFECDGPITGCTITGNHAGDSGGGLFGCYGTISSCDISGNSANANGGGACACGSLKNCIISGNWAGGDGGGIVDCHQLNSCIVVGNTAGLSGGGMSGCGYGLVITNCTFAWNTAGGIAGGIGSCEPGVTLTNTILWGNTGGGVGGELGQFDGDAPDISFSCIQDDDPNDANIPFGGADNNNIDDYPMFVRDANDGGDGWGVGGNDDFGDLHLLSGSPCINMGNPFSWIGPEGVDIDGEPRLMGGTIDMGADEFPYPRIVVTKPQGGEVWVGASSHQITWLSEIYEGTVDILLSDDAGSNWQVVESGIAGVGSYLWHLPEAIDSSQCLISVVPGVPDPNVVIIESGLFTIQPDTPGPPVTSRWKSLGGDFDRIGLSENYGPELGCIKWQFEIDGAISAGVTVGPNDTVYVPCEDGRLYKLDANGALLWSYDTNSPLISSPTIGADGTVYVGSKNGKLYAVNIDGSLRWTHTTGGLIYSSPAVSADGNNVYVCSQDGKLYALGRDGSDLWSFETSGFGVIDGSIFASPAIGADGTVYIGGLYDPNLYALDPNDGSVKWVCNFERFINPYHPWEGTESGWLFASPVIAEDGTIYQTLLYDPNLYAIDPNNGNIIWATHLAKIAYLRFSEYEYESYSPWFEPYYYEDRHFYPHGIYWYDWYDRWACGYVYRNALYNVGDSGWSEPVLGPDGTIYVSFDDPYLRAVEPNGAIKWIRQIGARSGYTETCGDLGCGWYSASRPAMGFSLTVGNDGLIYAASNDSNLYVVNPDGLEVSRFDSNDYWLDFPVISADNTLIVSDSRDNSMLISYANNKVWAIGGDGCEGWPLDLYWQGGPQDLDGDGAVDSVDFALLARNWLRCTDCSNWEQCGYPRITEPYLTGDINRDRYVDLTDIAALVEKWLSGY